MVYLYLNIIHTGNHLFFYLSLVTGITLVRVTLDLESIETVGMRSKCTLDGAPVYCIPPHTLVYSWDNFSVVTNPTPCF